MCVKGGVPVVGVAVWDSWRRGTWSRRSASLLRCAFDARPPPRCRAGSWLQSAKAYFGVLLFSGYIVYDLQQMMGGGKARQVRPDEHVLAALSLFVDLINLFLNVLQAMAAGRERD